MKSTQVKVLKLKWQTSSMYMTIMYMSPDVDYEAEDRVDSGMNDKISTKGNLSTQYWCATVVIVVNNFINTVIFNNPVV